MKQYETVQYSIYLNVDEYQALEVTILRLNGEHPPTEVGTVLGGPFDSSWYTLNRMIAPLLKDLELCLGT